MAKPNSPDARSLQAFRTLQKAVQCQQQMQNEAAERHYAEVLKSHPNYFDALLHYGVFKYQHGHLQDASQLLTKATALNPHSIDALNNLGSVLFGLKRTQDALAAFNRALALDPRNVQTLYNIGYALDNLKRHPEALAHYDRALAAQPDYFPALYNRGRLLHEIKQYGEALISLDRALAVQPNDAEALNMRAVVLNELGRFAEALITLDRALAIAPAFANAHYNRGHALHDMKRFEEALAAFGQASAIQPDYAQAHFSEATCRLLIEDFERGWQKYEWRWEVEPQRSFKRNFSQPLWQKGEDITGKTILLHYEQGYGDTIQFCRYVPLVAARGARVVLEVLNLQKELVRNLAGVAEVISFGGSSGKRVGVFSNFRALGACM